MCGCVSTCVCGVYVCFIAKGKLGVNCLPFICHFSDVIGQLICMVDHCGLPSCVSMERMLFLFPTVGRFNQSGIGWATG